MKKSACHFILLLLALLGFKSNMHAQEFYVKTKNLNFKWPSAIEKVKTVSVQKDFYKGKAEQLLRIRLKAGTDLKTTIQSIQENSAILWIEEVIDYDVLENTDGITALPNDPARAVQQPWLESIQASATWEKGTGSSDVIIAIIDTGVDYNHEDLSENRWINEDEIPENGIDDDLNGYVDDVNGWDFFEENGNPLPKGSSNNHGTHVAGLAAAVTNNGTGIAALSYNTRFMPIKISDNNGRNLRYAVESIIYAVDNGADIINCSWGSTRYSRALEDAINYAWEKGVIVVSAAGNDGTTSVYYPAGYARSIAVAAINFRDLKKSSFSNYGGFVDVLAPGGETNEGLYSTLPNNAYGPSFGTSMASPLVAAALGIMKSIETDWDAATLRAQLEAHAVPLHTQNPSLTYLLGDGLIQPAQSLLPELKPRANLLFFHFGDRENVATVFNRNDEFDVFLEIENLGKQENTIRIDAISMNNFVEVLSGNGTSYTAIHGEIFQTQAIRFRVSSDAQVNTKARIRLEFTYSDASKSWEVIDVNLVPDHIVHSINTIELGVNGTGRIGFFNYPTNTIGSGFVIKREGTTQTGLVNVPLLRESGLLFGTSSNRISSSIRGINNSVDDEFFLVDYFESSLDAENGVQKGRAQFTDLKAGVEGVRFDIQTTLESFAQSSETDKDYIILKYTLENQSATEFYPKIRAGVFFDFDMPFNDASNDITFYDEQNDIIAQFSGGTETDTTQYIGVGILEGIYTPWIIDNNAVNSNLYFGISYNANDSRQNGFTDQEKWLALDTRDAALLSNRRRIGPANTSFVVSPSAFNLNINEKASFTVILAQSIGYENLLTTMQRAKSQAPILTHLERTSQDLPNDFSIISNYPNPFNPSTTIRYQLNSSQVVFVQVFDVLGRLIYSDDLGLIGSGTHHYSLNSSNWASGVYLVRMQAGNTNKSIKITYLK